MENEQFCPPEVEAELNMQSFMANSYVGRGFVVGLNESGAFIYQVAWTMGRGSDSRNRVYTEKDGRLFTEAANPVLMKDPTNIIYNAMREFEAGTGVIHVVSNGHQTDAVVEASAKRQSFYDVMGQWSFEKDPPNSTARITAISSWFGGGPLLQMAILRKSQRGTGCDRCVYEITDHPKGLGYCLTTYEGDGKPLPAYRGEPYLMPLCGSARQILETYWNALNHDNRVSLAVKTISMYGPSQIIHVDQYSKVAA